MSESPKSWALTSIADVTCPPATVDWRTWGSPKFTYIDIGSVDGGAGRIVSPKEIVPEEAPSRARQIVHAGDTVFSTVRTYLRNIAYIDHQYDGQIASTGFCVLRPVGVHPRYIFHYVRSSDFIRKITAQQRGVSYPAVTDAQVKGMTIPIPPLAEQHRIVAAIEEQSSRLDAGMVAIDRVRHALRRMRVSLLHSAVTGRLVQADPMRWDIRSLPSLGKLDRGRSRHRPRNDASLYGGAYPFIQTGDVTTADPWIDNYTQTYSDAGLAQSQLWPKGTLCITIAANIAKSGILTFDACFPDSVVGFVALDGEVATRWVDLVIRSMQGRLERLAPATAQKNINLRVLRSLEIPFPSQFYQAEVLAEYDRRMSLIMAIEKTASQVVQRSDALRSSLLVTAFSGNLVRQDLNDESASVLLERIRIEREASNGHRLRINRNRGMKVTL